MAEQNEYQSAEATGAALADPVFVEETPYTVVPNGYRIENLEALKARPNRIRERAELTDEDSFIAYYEAFKNDDSAIFVALPPACEFRALMDYHGGNHASWCTHAATYTCPKSEPWKIWTAKHHVNMNQRDFAEFIEDNLDDIFTPDDEPAAPTAADMLEVSRSLQAHKKVNFLQSTRLESGDVSLTYEEETRGSTTKGAVQIPENFYLLLAPFANGQMYRLRARFRYRIQEGGLSLRYDLHRCNAVIEDAFNDIRKRIAETTEATMFSGDSQKVL